MIEITVTQIPDLLGQTVTSIDGCEVGSEQLILKLSSGNQVRFFHEQDCCEHVRVAEVHGEPSTLIGRQIAIAEVTSHQEHFEEGSQTWTFYRFATVAGTVTVRWLGESPGFYSEEVDMVVEPC